MCLLLHEPQDKIESILIKTTEHISNFILLCTTNFQIFRFVCTLRSINLTTSELKPIVIMCPRIPTRAEFSVISDFPMVFFFVGDPSKSFDLAKAGLLRADRVVLMNISNKENFKVTKENEALSDSATIMISNLIHKICDDAGIRKHIITDLRISI
jgi:voltage-gated potassium channel Kch